MTPSRFSLKDFGVAWLAGGLVTYFVWAFLDRFYASPWPLLLGGIPLYGLATGIVYGLIPGIRLRFRLERHWLPALVLLAAGLFSLAVVWLVLQFPRLADPAFLALDAAAFPWLLGLAVFSALWIPLALVWMHGRGLDRRFLSSRFAEFLLTNLPGLLLSLAFFIAYFSLALAYSTLLRDPSRNFDDNFYDADPTSWMNRLAAPASGLIEMRPVHPLGFLIFRPLVWLAALPLNGDRFHAALLLNAAAGALCVLLAWILVRRWSDPAFAGLAAFLLGVSASHLVFSTFLETYMFSAAALIGFLLLVTAAQRSLRSLVPLGLLVFGITITNFLQTLLLMFDDFRTVKFLRYVLAVPVLALVLAWVQLRLYPTTQPFYDLHLMLAENRYSSNVSRLDRLYERGYVLARTMTLYSVVGPRPLALTQEVGCDFPCFKTYKPRYGRDLITSYAGFGSWLARSWGGILAVSAGLFAWKLYRSPRGHSLQLALLGCLLFNFVLHLLYGDDPMLYSPDWTYALVFFVALSLKDYAARLWFQAAGLVLLGALLVNNWNFLRLMLLAVAPYL